jgi:hypothetical protein
MLALAGLAASQLDNVRLDASSDSLLLQGDPDLAFALEATDDLSSGPWSRDLFEEVGKRVPDPRDNFYQFITMEADLALFPKFFARLRVSR